MTRLILALVALLAFGGLAHAQSTPTTWVLSFAAGGMENNHFLGGTEIRQLVPWNPGKTDAKLYAANGYWEDTPGPEGFQTAQILVLDRSQQSGGVWREDVNFGPTFCPTRNPRCALAVSAMDKVLFTADKNGTAVKAQVLLAGTWDVRSLPTPVNVYAKNNVDGRWYETTLEWRSTAAKGPPQVRSFAEHRDRVTNQDFVFAGESPSGIFHGMLSDTRGPGRNIIEWTTGAANVEFSIAHYSGPPCNGENRVTGIAESGGILFATVCYQAYQRIDGPQGSCAPDEVTVNVGCQQRWQVVWTEPEPRTISDTGLRGLTSTTFNGNDIVLVAEEGLPMRIGRMNPLTRVGSVEIDVKNTLAPNWDLPVTYGIGAYNNMPLWRDTNGVGKQLIGLQAYLEPSSPQTQPLPDRPIVLLDNGSKLQGDAWYIMRNAAYAYELVHIPPLMTTTPMVSVRTAAASPFVDECNGQGWACAIYFGGFDANFSSHVAVCKQAPCTFSDKVDVHNTGWIVKGSGAR